MLVLDWTWTCIKERTQFKWLKQISTTIQFTICLKALSVYRNKKNSFCMIGYDVFATFQNSLPAGAKYEFTLSCLCCKTAPVKDLQLCKSSFRCSWKQPSVVVFSLSMLWTSFLLMLPPVSRDSSALARRDLREIGDTSHQDECLNTLEKMDDSLDWEF